MHNILLLPHVARCLETIGVCIWCMFVFMSVVVSVGVYRNVFVFQPLLNIVFFLALEC